MSDKNKAPALLDSKEKFLEDFSNLHGAAVGVIAVRTREPYRFMDALKEFSYEKKMQFKVWKITSGWSSYDPADAEAAPKADNDRAVIGALEKLAAEGNPKVQGGTPMPQNIKGYVYAMQWAHHFASKDKSMADVVQILAEYSKMFSEAKKRLVLVVPPEYAMPAELQDMMVMVDTDLPTQEELREVYSDLADYITEQKDEKGKSKNPNYSEDDVSRITSAGAGMTISEFETTVSRAFRSFRNELPNVTVEEFVRLVSQTKAEIVKRSDCLELMPLGSMSDVGGLEYLKEWIETRKHAYSDAAREFGVDAPKGCALIGPPGTGKSLCAKAIAHTLGLPLVRFDVSRVFGQYVGNSESNVRAALKLIDAMSPCVVMLDEIDKMFDANGGGGDSGVGKRVLGAVLTHMQESQKPVFWVMTANRVGSLPAELLRKGRLDETFSVTLPAENERRAIFEIHLRKRKQDPKKVKNLDIAVERSAGFVGAEIETAVKEAVLLAYANKTQVTGDLIAQQFEHSKPLSIAHAEQFSQMREWAEANARPASKEKPPETPRQAGQARSRAVPDSLGKKNRKLDMDS